MSETIKLVQNDTKPDIDVTLTDGETGAPINFSNGSDVVRMYFRRVGATTLKATLTASKPNGGGDGLARFAWGATDLNTAGEFEAEVEITFADGTKHTTYDLLNFTIRPQLG